MVPAEPEFAWITSTVGMAWALVQAARLSRSWKYARMRADTIRAAMPRAAIPAYFSRRRLMSRRSMGLSDMGLSCVPGRIARMGDGKYDGYEEQRGHGGEHQATDDRQPQGLVLLAALAETYGHGQHADDHGQSCHDHRPETGEPGFDGRHRRVTGMRQAFAGEAHHQDAVGGGDAHAHDGAGERRHRQGGVGGEQHPDDAGERR